MKKAKKPKIIRSALLIKQLTAELAGARQYGEELERQRSVFGEERMRMKLYADSCERRFIAIRALVNDNPPR